MYDLANELEGIKQEKKAAIDELESFKVMQVITFVKLESIP